MFDYDLYQQFATVREAVPRGEILHVFGDVDLATVGNLNEAIDEAVMDGGGLLINLTKCRYFDSSGLAALIRARKRLGTRLTVLVQPQSQILRIVRVAGLNEILNVVTELHAHVESMAAANAVAESH